ncbi:MAG: hypothetical protein J7642_14150 [Cyanobacteria bacterium SBC]|nr:hypothetical protein [Cyanobacteria bacterium SBC]
MTLLAFIMTGYIGLTTPKKYGPLPFGISLVVAIAMGYNLLDYWRVKQDRVNKFHSLNQDLFEEFPSFWQSLPLIDDPDKIHELKTLSELHDRKLYPEDFNP